MYFFNQITSTIRGSLERFTLLRIFAEIIEVEAMHHGVTIKSVWKLSGVAYAGVYRFHS